MDDFALHTHLVGKPGSRRELNTPCLIVDVEALDRNILRMAAFARAHGLALRPHAKTHKSAEIARRQISAGALGVCCAKLGEAGALADAGIAAIHITSPVVSAPAVTRLLALRARVQELTVVVDHPANVAALAAAAKTRGVQLGVLIDVDPGIHRTGVSSPAKAVELALAIKDSGSLVYAGVQFYCAVEQHIERYDDRKAAVETLADYLRGVIKALAVVGAEPAIVTGGGTGTHQIDAGLGLFTELQVGSYVFMDRQYLACETSGSSELPFETALFVDTGVVSANAPGMVTVDGGYKALASDAGPPAVLSGAPTGASYIFMGDEHGGVILPAGSEQPMLADVITLGAPHCDPTVNLYDVYHVISGDTLTALWPVTARGRSR